MNLYQKNLADNQIAANSTFIEVSSFQAPLASIDFGELFQQYNNPQGWMMVGGMLFVLLLLQILKKHFTFPGVSSRYLFLYPLVILIQN
ncbi:MAG: hypothetical protein V7K38_21225 [Nostoc sp.]|uniref:hypothetical protein n=1 Tax=Nostoc sp. TaxID=1180 RepID=UPI002FFB4AFB